MIDPKLLKFSVDPAPLIIGKASDKQTGQIMEVLFNRLAIGRKAFMDTMKDPGFLKEAKLLKLTVNPLRGTQVEKLLERVANYSPEVLVRAQQIVLESE